MTGRLRILAHRRVLGHGVDWYRYGMTLEEGYCSCGRIWMRRRT